VSLTVPILHYCFLNKNSVTELEFVVSGDLLNVGRVKEYIELDSKCSAYVKPKTVSGPWESGPQLKLELITPSRLETFQFREDVREELGPQEV